MKKCEFLSATHSWDSQCASFRVHAPSLQDVVDVKLWGLLHPCGSQSTSNFLGSEQSHKLYTEAILESSVLSTTSTTLQ